MILTWRGRLSLKIMRYARRRHPDIYYRHKMQWQRDKAFVSPGRMLFNSILGK